MDARLAAEVIIAIDPGITTGVATCIKGKYKVMEIKPYVNVWQYLNIFPWEQVICENFTATDISKYGIITVRIIGGIEEICIRKEVPLTIQQNIMRIPYIPRAVEIIGKLPRDHRKDALAHLLRWQATQ